MQPNCNSPSEGGQECNVDHKSTPDLSNIFTAQSQTIKRVYVICAQALILGHYEIEIVQDAVASVEYGF